MGKELGKIESIIIIIIIIIIRVVSHNEQMFSYHLHRTWQVTLFFVCMSLHDIWESGVSGSSFKSNTYNDPEMENRYEMWK